MSNFKNTVYSILNEAPEDRDTRMAREEAEAEVKRKAAFERRQAKRKAEIDNPRNSEGDFITLKDGRILFIYTHYTGQSGADWGNAYLASRFSSDNGKTWSKESKIEVQQEGVNNVMSVSMVRLLNGSIALFNLKIDGEFLCSPWMRISTDEGNTL